MVAKILENLNPRQREAAEYIDGPLLIVAGPGSGKTRVITCRIAYLLQACGIAPQNIAAMTFTNKAANEMQDRLASLLGSDVRGLTVNTFHAFCAMVLRRDGSVIGLDKNFAIYDDSDQMTAIKRSMKETGIDERQFKPRAILSQISHAKSQLWNPIEFSINRTSYYHENVLRAYERYEEILAMASAVDFDDLLLKTHTLFSTAPEITKRYADRYVHLMIDEFQDTNTAQYAIAKLLCQEHRNLCAVGDPDQSIYTWRNADIRNILSFQKDFPDARIIALEENYRSTQTILEAATSVIASNAQRVDKELWTHNPSGVPIVISESADEIAEAQLVLNEIRRLVSSTSHNTYTPNDIAVMYRTNRQSKVFEDECHKHKLPYQIVGGMKFYQRQEIKNLASFLHVVLNPHNDVILNRVINVPARGIGRRTLEELLRVSRNNNVSMYSVIESLSQKTEQGIFSHAQLPTRSVRALIEFQNIIVGLQEAVQHTNIGEFIDLVLERTGYKAHLTEEDDRGEDRLENLEEFRNSAIEYSSYELEDGLQALLQRVSLVNDVDAWDESASSLTLITLHQAKGLEFPIVFMVGMEEGVLPHSRSMSDPKEIEEERRLCYVGMTRAKERLYLTRSSQRRWSHSDDSGHQIPSRFLSDIPEKLIVFPGNINSEQLHSTTRRSRTPRYQPGQSRRLPSAKRKEQITPTIPEKSEAVINHTEIIYYTGDKVHHEIFGPGIVISCDKVSNDMDLAVAFKEGAGIKRLLASIAPMKKI